MRKVKQSITIGAKRKYYAINKDTRKGYTLESLSGVQVVGFLADYEEKEEEGLGQRRDEDDGKRGELGFGRFLWFLYGGFLDQVWALILGHDVGF
nr:hypothetical protein Itr_chr08CG01000 [Ipomoea trifida]GMD42531.1 hypothetical protein Iba_chr10bCG10240 [Ipomoea batatas]